MSITTSSKPPTMELADLNEVAREVIALSMAELRRSGALVQTEFADVFSGRAGAGEVIASRLKVLEAGDVARAILWVVTQPPHVEVHDILVRPTAQEL